MGALSTGVRREMLNCTYPALYIVMFAIMEVFGVRQWVASCSIILSYLSKIQSQSHQEAYLFLFQGNTRERTWVNQQMKTVHITKENHRALDTITKVKRILSR